MKRAVIKNRMTASEYYTSHTSGDGMVLEIEPHDRNLSSPIHIIWATSPTDSHFNDAATGSLLIYLNSGVVKVKTGATTWTIVGTQS